MTYVVVGYYTKNTGYEEEVHHLRQSLARFNLPSDLVGIASQGSWQANTQYKAYFLKHMLTRHYPNDLLYLDADARVQQYPTLFDQVDFDVGVYFFANKELVSSTLYLRNNAKVYELLERWIICCFNQPDVWDQKLLHYAIQESEDLHLSVRLLPPTYCQIFDLMKDVGQPVIEQFQASRRYKSQVDQSS